MNQRRWLRLIWLIVIVVLAFSPLNKWLDQKQPRLLLMEMPAWFSLGWMAGVRFRSYQQSFNPHGLTGFIFFLGTLGFWMIPRSVDLISISTVADQMMHANFLVAGAVFSASRFKMPFVLRAAGAIYGTSMIFSLGMLYTGFSALLCGSFDLEQQKQTGRLLLLATPTIMVLAIVRGAYALDRESKVPDPGSR